MMMSETARAYQVPEVDEEPHTLREEMLGWLVTSGKRQAATKKRG